MSQCIQCGSPDGDERFYVCVEVETETVPGEKPGRKISIRKETVTEIAPYAVCPDCARKAKLKAVLWTIPITLIATPVLVFLSLFAVRPNRNIRSEVTSWPITVPIVAVIFWLCGLSVYLPRPKELYAAELVRKRVGKPNNAFLVPLEPRCYTRREKPVEPLDITYRTALKSDLAEKLVPVINGEADVTSLQGLVGQTFIKEENTRR